MREQPNDRRHGESSSRGTSGGTITTATTATPTTNNTTNSNQSTNTATAETTALTVGDSSSTEITITPSKQYPSHFKTQPEQQLIRRALKKSPFFASLTSEQMERFVTVAEKKTYAPGEIVILEGCIDDKDIDFEDKGGENQWVHVETAMMASVRDGVDNDRAIRQVPEMSDNAHLPLSIMEKTSEDTSLDAVGAPQRLSEEATDDTQTTTESESIPLMAAEPPDTSSESGQESPIHESMSLAAVSDEKDSGKETDDHSFQAFPEPPPPRSGIRRSVYIVANGKADVWYQPQNFRPASLGRGMLFGEGGFLFGRQHSASVVAASSEPHSQQQPERSHHPNSTQTVGLECWVVDFVTFREYVLPTDEFKLSFHQSATKRDENGVPFMTMEDFAHIPRKSQVDLLADDSGVRGGGMNLREDPMASLQIVSTFHKSLQPKIATQHDDQADRIYLEDYCFYQLLMDRPDPEVDIAFLLMDQKQTGHIYLEDLAKFTAPLFPDLDFKSQFFERYFGRDGNRCIRQVHFSQFLVDFQREIGKQAFLRAVAEKEKKMTTLRVEGYLEPTEFISVLTEACGWRLPQGVTDRLKVIYLFPAESLSESNLVGSEEHASMARHGLSSHADSTSRYFSYGDFLAFQEVLGNLPGICNLIDRAEEVKKGPVSPEDFKVANQVMGLGGRLSRRQVEIVFALFDRDHDGLISRDDTVSVCGMDFVRRLAVVPGRSGRLTLLPSHLISDEAPAIQPNDKPWIERASIFLINFAMFSLSSSVGMALFYPLDLAKTRLMNERIPRGGTALYHGWMDCLKHVIRAESPLGLYRGLIPQILGVGPERLIKLKVNDLLRQALGSDPDGGDPAHEDSSELKRPTINYAVEIISGACAGACQLLITNPMDITKIRMQLEGQKKIVPLGSGVIIQPPSFTKVVRELGFPGVYRGATSCLLRDIPFSAIYFPTYTAIKEMLVNQDPEPLNRRATATRLLIAGTLAAIPASLLTAPADVIKTRLQSAQPTDQPTYAGIRDCATTIYRTEGVEAFFRGSIARTLRIAPQFGISLLAYEEISQWMASPTYNMSIEAGIHGPPTYAPIDPRDYQDSFSPR